MENNAEADKFFTMNAQVSERLEMWAERFHNKKVLEPKESGKRSQILYCF
jgi:hypothetical protein